MKNGCSRDWGHSSAGRALQWHCRGQRFDPAWLHHPSPQGFKFDPSGGVAEWLKAADCKSARDSVRWFESSPLHHDTDHRTRFSDRSAPAVVIGAAGLFVFPFSLLAVELGHRIDPLHRICCIGSAAKAHFQPPRSFQISAGCIPSRPFCPGFSRNSVGASCRCVVLNQVRTLGFSCLIRTQTRKTKLYEKSKGSPPVADIHFICP